MENKSDFYKINDKIQQGLALQREKHFSEAESVLKEVLEKTPGQCLVLAHLGLIYLQTGKFEEGITFLEKSLEINPKQPEVLSNLGFALSQLSRDQEGIEKLDKALELKPDYPEALNNRGIALQKLGRLDEAMASLDRAIALRSTYPEALFNRGNILERIYKLEEALNNYEQAIALMPDFADAFNNRGNVLMQLGQSMQALASFERSLTLRQNFPEAWNNQGLCLHQARRFEEALESYETALLQKTDYPEALYNRGNTLRELKRFDEALACYDRSLALRPDFLETCFNRAVTLHDLKRFEESLQAYNQLLGLNPASAETWNNRGNLLQDMRRHQEALESYQKALEVNPDCEFLLGTFLNAKMKVCDWNGLEENLGILEKRIDVGEKVTTPFSVLSLLDLPSFQRKASEIYVETKYAAVKPDAIGKKENTGKTRVGYYSADFHDHATSYLMAELFESHDRSRFEIFGFSFGPSKNDEMRNRVSPAFDNFLDVTKKTDREVSNLSRKLGVDIAVDLKGYTLGARPGIFAERCAPIQVNYLGYPGTMGAPFIDYIIADKILIPEESRKHYREKIIYMPNSYQVNDSKRKILDKACTREEAGLPLEGFVFCCFNNNYKILPTTFDSWMRILEAVEGSVLWLLEDNPTAAGNLRKEADRRGINNERLVFAKRMPLAEHLARHRLADLFLDTWPYNAHTTASDALWAGLPLITLIGRSFASRVAASVLKGIGLSDLITHSREEYEVLAVELARKPERLSEIKSRLAKNRLTSSLFNGKLFARHLEAAFSVIFDRYRKGLPPAQICLEQKS